MHRITSPNVVLNPGDCARSRLHVLRRGSREEETKGTWIATKANARRSIRWNACKDTGNTMRLHTSGPRHLLPSGYHAVRAHKRMRRRSRLITAFWKQAELF